GSMLSRIALPWLATLALDATPLEMALLLVADVAAGAAGALLLGTLVDRLARRSVMLATDVARAALLGGVAALAWVNALSMPLLALAAALSGALGVAFELARSAWVAQSATAERLSGRNAQLSAVGSVSETLAFALGGWIYQLLGAALAVAVDALSYLLSALCLVGLRSGRERPVTRGPAVHAVHAAPVDPVRPAPSRPADAAPATRGFLD